MFDEAIRDQVRKARGSEGFEQRGKWLHLCIEKSIGKKKKKSPLRSMTTGSNLVFCHFIYLFYYLKNFSNLF